MLELAMNNASMPWSSDEVAIVKKLYPTRTAKELGAMIGRTPKSVYHMAKSIGIAKTHEERSAVHRRIPRSDASIPTRFKPKHGLAGFFGGKRHPTYTAWRSMHSRCGNPSRQDFHRYGGRGIKVCLEWDDFSQFLADMGHKPSRMAQLGRIDNDGNYEPSNCRWETPTQQARNRRSSVMLEAFGMTQCLADWAGQYGIRGDTLTWRLKNRARPESALTTPVGIGLKPETLRPDEELVKGVHHPSNCVTWRVIRKDAP